MLVSFADINLLSINSLTVDLLIDLLNNLSDSELNLLSLKFKT